MFGKFLTLTGLRHSFLSSLEWSALSRLDREKLPAAWRTALINKNCIDMCPYQAPYLIGHDSCCNRPEQNSPLRCPSKSIYCNHLILGAPANGEVESLWQAHVSGCTVGWHTPLVSWHTCVVTYTVWRPTLNTVHVRDVWVVTMSRLHYLYSVVQHMCCHINFVEGKSTALQRCVLWGGPFVWNSCSTCAVCVSVLAVTQ